ncbi:hypothetical protein [Natronomonas marina]|uniref:hypothetical protein n=1 Tax=Natronomonas marina TaxID=2961939 RepID=UPI0020C9F2D0|nr:hypothetical protein [Natronomonas marina]
MSQDTRETDRTDYKPTLGAVSHTNPYTGEAFGDTQTYDRGRTVAADGGEANAESRTSSEAKASDDEEGRNVDEETMEDVAHEPPGETEGAQAAYDRGAGHE